MCGYGNRVPHGWHRISDERIVVDVIKAFSRIVPDRKDSARVEQAREADEKMLADIAAKPDDPWPHGMY